MDKLSEHAIRMLEIADNPYWNEYNMVNKDLKDTHDIAKAVYDIILQVQMLKMAKRKTEPQNEYCPTCGQMYPKWIREQNEPKTEPLDKDTNVRSKEPKTEPRIITCPIQEEDAEYARWLYETEPQTDPCDGCVCDDGKHLMYCMNCKGIAWETEPPKVEGVPQTDCAWGKGK